MQCAVYDSIYEISTTGKPTEAESKGGCHELWGGGMQDGMENGYFKVTEFLGQDCSGMNSGALQPCELYSKH